MRRLVQAFLEARATALGPRLTSEPTAVLQEEGESQQSDEYGDWGVDWDDPRLLAALGQGEKTMDMVMEERVVEVSDADTRKFLAYADFGLIDHCRSSSQHSRQRFFSSYRSTSEMEMVGRNALKINSVMTSGLNAGYVVSTCLCEIISRWAPRCRPAERRLLMVVLF